MITLWDFPVSRLYILNSIWYKWSMIFLATTKPYKYCEDTKQSFQNISLDMWILWKRALSIFLCSDLATIYEFHGAEYLLNRYVTFHEWEALIKDVQYTVQRYQDNHYDEYLLHSPNGDVLVFEYSVLK